MTQQPLISIVTPSYNQGHFIAETIESILNQSYSNVEYIIMDGGSTDNTIEVIERYADDERLRWVSETDKGQSDAINKGMRHARGDILAYLNSDDIYLPGSFQTVADTFTQFPDIDLVHGDCQTIDADSNHLRQILIADDYNLEKALTRRWHVAQPATFWRRNIIDSIGLFDETLHYTMDYDYWLRATMNGHRTKAVHQTLAGFRLHGDSKTGAHEHKFIADIEKTLEKASQHPDYREQIQELKPVIESYFNLDCAAIFWRSDNRIAARPYLQKTLTNPGYFKARFRAGVMLLDSYLHTPFHKWLVALYGGQTTNR